jgi:hypothetical protein
MIVCDVVSGGKVSVPAAAAKVVPLASRIAGRREVHGDDLL